MKRRIAGAFILAGVIFTVPAMAMPRIQVLVGDVQFWDRGGETWEPAGQGQKLEVGDMVKTGESSYAEIAGEGNIIRVNANSRIRMSTSIVNEEKSSSVSLFLGSLFLKIQKLRKDGGGFAVETPTAFCAVRGTQFVVASGYDGETLVQVTDGTVTLRGDEKEVTINRDEESVVKMGGEPSPVARLKKRAWERWAMESRTRIKGRERSVLRACLLKMNRLNSDIITLENKYKEFTERKDEYLNKVKQYRKERKRDLYREFIRKAHESRRAAYVALTVTYYKAEKLDLIRNVAENAFESASRKDGNLINAFERIRGIYERNYEKYIQKIEAERSLNQRIRQRRLKR